MCKTKLSADMTQPSMAAGRRLVDWSKVKYYMKDLLGTQGEQSLPESW